MISLFFSFIVNILILFSFLSLVSYFYPLNFIWLLKIMHEFHIPITHDYKILTLSIILILLPCLFINTDIIQRYICWIHDCHKPENEEKDRLEKALAIVCERAGLNPSDFNIYVCDVNYFNAFAIGKNNIAVTRPTINIMYMENLAGLIAHEMGHITYGHTRKSLFLYIFSLFGDTVLTLYAWIAIALQFFSFIPVVNLLTNFIALFFILQVHFFRFLLQLPVILVIRFGSRLDEYAADKYACSLGLGEGLYYALEFITQGEEKLSFWNKLMSEHPDTQSRLQRIKRSIL